MENFIQKITVIVPVLNEEHYIVNCIESMLTQSYPKDRMEWFFVDGGSSDNTKSIIEKYQKDFPNLIKVFDNPKKTQANAMNLGISKSTGDVIVRMDAHAKYDSNYIKRCVFYLFEKDVDNVGGIINTVSNRKGGEYIAKVLSSKFGVGNSEFRTNGGGYVDTVPFGVFRKETFQKYGVFDTRFDRNEDNEFNYRIIKNGGKIYLANDVSTIYYCRNTLKSLIKMAFQNGKWNLISMKLSPGSMKMRHLAPLIALLLFVGMIIVGFLWHPFWIATVASFLIYFVLDFSVSLKTSSSFFELLKLIFCFPLFHFFYAIGSFFGLFCFSKAQ